MGLRKNAVDGDAAKTRMVRDMSRMNGRGEQENIRGEGTGWRIIGRLSESNTWAIVGEIDVRGIGR